MRKSVLKILGWSCIGAAAGSLLSSGLQAPIALPRDLAILGIILLLIAWRQRA